MASPSVSASASFSLASTIPTSVESVQDDLSFPTTKFTSIQDLFSVIDRVTRDFLAVTDVSPSLVNEIECERDKRRSHFRIRRYESSRRILFITIPTDLHEALHINIYERFRDQLVIGGTQHTWKTIGTATRRAQYGHPGGNGGGQGDSAGGPKAERAGVGAWPTLVIEAGDSESLIELHNDMVWWFSASGHDVQIVLLAKFDRTHRTLILEKWEEEAHIPGRPGATSTRVSSALEPVLRQTITITEDTTTDPITYNVARGALVLGFKLLYLRDPEDGEGDFVISVQELQGYAEDVWTAVQD